jgi:hypothetical protein
MIGSNSEDLEMAQKNQGFSCDVIASNCLITLCVRKCHASTERTQDPVRRGHIEVFSLPLPVFVIQHDIFLGLMQNESWKPSFPGIISIHKVTIALLMCNHAIRAKSTTYEINIFSMRISGSCESWSHKSEILVLATANRPKNPAEFTASDRNAKGRFQIFPPSASFPERRIGRPKPTVAWIYLIPVS